MPAMNHQICLAARPQGWITPGCWRHVAAPVQQPADGQFAARTRYISVDPAMRRWLDDRRSYSAPIGIGEVMRAQTVVEVTESDHPEFQPGDHVVGYFGVQDYVVSNGEGARKIDPDLAASSVFLGALGLSGMTAYFGLLDVGALREGETVVVSAAAGAVGSMVGQIAKLKGARVIGIAGGRQKCTLVTNELGFDDAVDYRAEDVSEALRARVPDGIDLYFDNVGGEILDAAVACLALRARVVVCGAISQYNNDIPVRGPSNYLSLLVCRARMEGFVVTDYAARFAEAAAEIAGWINNGQITVREHIVKGTVEDFPETLQMLFRGDKVGKLVLELM
ncbi:NADP-dependent oxidoreductase [Mycobacterium sp. DBP42]|uniref:NADP-dependent oxidoreductase n=1 Tax=Mycobacterium sp. DBP42 TaxID=2545267 RepID=UPI001486A081|nr:NADP-dependent oxidoreductase [Mycobacterium sp. DBP42]